MQDILISNNSIKGNRSGSALTINSGVNGCIVSNNLITNSFRGATAIAPYRGQDRKGSYIVGVDSVTISKNTISNTTTSDWPSTYAIVVNTYCNYINIINNTIVYDSTKPYYKTGGI